MRRTRPAPRPSLDPPADKIVLLESVDGFAQLRNGLRRLAGERDHWAGIPMPLDYHSLVIEPTFPNAAALECLGKPPAENVPADTVIRNRFWSRHKRCDVVIYEERGKLNWGTIPGAHHFDYDLETLGASIAWGIEQEARAVNTLGTMLRHHAFKKYLMTGMFLETSARSGVTYAFRKLRPTVALSFKGETTHILCTLCLHPIGYYAGSWAGAMCPTDDVIAHLSLMRGDEPMFWRRANQHGAHRPESGL